MILLFKIIMFLYFILFLLGLVIIYVYHIKPIIDEKRRMKLEYAEKRKRELEKRNKEIDAWMSLSTEEQLKVWDEIALNEEWEM